MLFRSANNVNTDACVSMCKTAKCGDGFIQAGVEACDDGNNANADGCSATCQTEAIPAIFLTSSNGTAGFYGYNILTNVWTTLTSPPAVTYSQITNIKAYSDGANGLGTGVGLYAKAVTSFATPAEATATTGYTDFFTYTSGSALSLGAVRSFELRHRRARALAGYEHIKNSH